MKTSTAGLLAALVLSLAGLSCGGSPLAPEPEPTPTPTPAPTATPEALGCPLAKMPDHGDCRNDVPEFRDHVFRAVEILIQNKPHLFDVNDRAGCDTCVRLVDPEGFSRQMVKELEKMGFCAVCDEECGVKNTNEWNEQYKLANSSGYVLKPEKFYKVTCYPAAF